MLDRRAFSYYDTNTKQWRADPGDFSVLVGRSSEDIKLRGNLTLAGSTTTANK
jgi:beta-glucosidase